MFVNTFLMFIIIFLILIIALRRVHMDQNR